MRKLAKLLLIMIISFILFGCGVQVQQVDNKIYTDISKDEAYNFSKAAIIKNGYKIKETDRNLGYMVADPEYNNTFKITDAEKTELKLSIKDDPEEKDQTIVEVLAYANGQIDEESSKEIAKKAVAEIINELDKYSKYEIIEDAEYIFPVATRENVQVFVANDFLSDNNYKVVRNDQNEGAIFIEETESRNPFNDPLRSKIFVLTDDANRVIVSAKTQLKGNYDVKGNNIYVRNFNRSLTSLLTKYPIIEKGYRFNYKFIGFDKAFTNALAAIGENQFVIGEKDQKNYIITASKDDIKLTASFTEINNNLAVNLETFSEGEQNTTKEELNDKLTKELNNLTESLSSRQTIKTSTKMFTSMSSSDALKMLQKALGKLGYNYKTNNQNLTISAQAARNQYLAHFVLVNSIGNDGVSIEINTLYNSKSEKAQAIVDNENAKLLKYLGTFDKTDLK